jgi:hypothetical protein
MDLMKLTKIPTLIRGAVSVGVAASLGLRGLDQDRHLEEAKC